VETCRCLRNESLRNLFKNVDTPESIKSCVEWFFGYGGNHLGLKRVLPAMRTVAACEIEAYCCSNLVAKMQAGLLDVAPIWTDCKTFPIEEFRGLVDLFVASYPCVGFSCAGKRLGKDDPRFLWPWVFRGVAVMRPRYCLFENVEGHVSLGLSTVISDLEAAGYRVEVGLFSAEEVGAPHQRKRIFILARDEQRREVADSSGERRSEIARSASSHEEANGRAGRDECQSNGHHLINGEGKGIGGETGMGDPTSQQGGGICESRLFTDDRGASLALGESVADSEVQRPGETRELRPGESEERIAGSSDEGSELAQPNGIECDGSGRARRRRSEDSDRRSDKELGNSQSDDQRWASVASMHGEGQPIGGSSSPELAHAPCQQRGQEQQQFNGSERVSAPERSSSVGVGPELADSDSSRRSKDRVESKLWSGGPEQSSVHCGDAGTGEGRQRRWPSRPGQPQYDWEAPRTTQSGLGRTTNGSSVRVDRLRMCGNGVVPDTAEKAFRTLFNRINDLQA